MLPDTHVKEKLSLSYVMALAANAGFICQRYEEDFGLDGFIVDVKYQPHRKGYRNSSFGVDFQLKATVNAIPKGGYFLYDLEAKNYFDLIEDDIGRERILILYILPKDRNEWLVAETDKTVVKRAAYWCSLKGQPRVNNKKTVRIRIPYSQQLTSFSLQEIMNRIKGGAPL